MPQVTLNNFGGLNTKVSPLLQPKGTLLTCVNLTNDYIGGKTKRPGIETFLNNPDSAQVNNIIDFESGTTHFLLRMSGSVCYYLNVNSPGTAWTPVANGTFPGGGRLGHTVLYDTIICGNGVGSTRHSTSGTAFTNTSLAPLSRFFDNNFGRVYAGNNQTMFWSSANDPTNWQTSGTSDSSSIQIPGAGTVNGVFSGYNRVIASKSSGEMHRWDTYSRERIPGMNGPISHWGGANIDDLRIYPNRQGVYAFMNNYPKLISTPIEKQIHNREKTGINGTMFPDLPGGAFRYNYFLSAGSVRDPMTGNAINNAVIGYDYLQNEFYNYQYPFLPTAYGSYTDASGESWQLLGDSTGQIYRVNGTVTTDNGTAIQSYMEGFSGIEQAHKDKEMKRAWVHTNPGCQAKLQMSVGSNLFETSRKWFDVGNLSRGVSYLEFPHDNNRGKYVFFRVYESSKDAPWTILGITFDFEYVGDK